MHGTRKTCASLLTALDVHPRVAMRILRHSKIADTKKGANDSSRKEPSNPGWALVQRPQRGGSFGHRHLGAMYWGRGLRPAALRQPTATASPVSCCTATGMP